MPPYVGMHGQKTNGGYNVSISVQTQIFHLVVNSTRLNLVFSETPISIQRFHDHDQLLAKS